MSMKMMVRVMEEVDVSRVQLATLSAMANYCDDDGRNCFPSVDRIAWLSGYKPRAIVDAMRELREMGVLREVFPAAGVRPAEYEIRLENAPQKLSFDDWKAAHGRHGRGAGNAPLARSRDEDRGANGAPQPDKIDSNRGAGNAPVQSAQGCIPRQLGVQSTQLGVHSTTARGAGFAPEPVEPVIEPVEPLRGVRREQPDKPKTKREPSGPAQEIVAAWCSEAGVDKPTSYAKAVGQAQHLANAGITAADIPAIMTWLRGDDFWARKGIDLGVIETNADKWRAAGRPSSPTAKAEKPERVPFFWETL